MSFSRSLALVITLATLITTGCGQTGGSPSVPSNTPVAAKAEENTVANAPETSQPSSRQTPSTGPLDALIQAAKNEGKVTISGSQAFVRDALAESFGKKFGLEVEYLHLSSGDLFTRLRTERQAGQHNLDVVLAGGTSLFLNMMPEGMLRPLDDILVVPEVIDTSKWIDGKIPWADPQHRSLRLNKYVFNGISINTSVVKPGEIKGYKDLLDPKWKGKIAGLDPTINGAGSAVGVFLLLTYGEDFVKQLYLGQDITFSRDERQLGDWLARGRYPILIWVNDAIMANLKKDGMPVELVVTPDVAPVSGGFAIMSMMNDTPHPNAAKLFVNWFATQEGQQMWTRLTAWPVTRTDVDQSAIPDYMKLKPGVKYVDTSDYDYVLNQASAEKRLHDLIPR